MAPSKKLDRLPPGQHKISKMVAMPPISGRYPHIEKKDWKLRVCGEVKKEKIWNWQEFLKLPQRDFKIDFHCVTSWSKLDQEFSGVAFQEIIKAVEPKASARFVIFECYDGYSTNVPLAELKDNVAFIATKMDGQDIEDPFGGPARVVIPHLYAWKSAKFLKAIRFAKDDEPGYWETRGYHNHGDPWKEERYS
jgi:DMSO/TMAO reductase YedYZ molybdopterin-dependent catalytic subunit